jgi:hypothetical protein
MTISVLSLNHGPFIPSHGTGCNTCWFPGRKTLRRILSCVSTKCPNIWQIGTSDHYNIVSLAKCCIRVVTLILCHDKPKNRAKQIEKLVEIAEKLRALNNYSALRAFVAGINNATYPGDPAIAKFQENNSKLHKHLQSWELLFYSSGSHRSYRMALRNSKGPCVPAL